MLQVILSPGLENLMPILTSAQERFRFRYRFEQIDERHFPSEGALLVVLASATPAFEDNLRMLGVRAHKQPLKVLVLRTEPGFDVEEAEKAWMDCEAVVGYDHVDRMLPGTLHELIRDLVERTAAPGATSDRVQVGSVLSLPGDQFDKHKFVSLFIGGTVETLIEVRRVLRVLRPLETEIKKHPFEESGSAKLFDVAVKEARSPKSSILGKLEETSDWGLIPPHLLVLGETGTGKTLLVRWLHRLRMQSRKWPDAVKESILQDLNCGGMSEKLLDAELFGGVAGAYTGLDQNSPGKIFCALHGTLFLDEIGELPAQTQAVLLKYLDNGEYYPLGWHGPRLKVATMVAAASNQPLEALVEQGRFRRDLYERFRFRIRLPSLRERMQHFETLVDFVLQNPSVNPLQNGGRWVKYISREALDHLKGCSWPGNFRELEQVLWRAVFEAADENRDTILPHHVRFSR